MLDHGFGYATCLGERQIKILDIAEHLADLLGAHGGGDEILRLVQPAATLSSIEIAGLLEQAKILTKIALVFHAAVQGKGNMPRPAHSRGVRHISKRKQDDEWFAIMRCML